MDAKGAACVPIERKDKDLLSGLPQVDDLLNGRVHLWMRSALSRFQGPVEFAQVPSGSRQVELVDRRLILVVLRKQLPLSCKSERFVGRAQRLAKQFCARVRCASRSKEERKKLGRRNQEAARRLMTTDRRALEPFTTRNIRSCPICAFVMADNPRSQPLFRSVSPALG